MIRFALAFVFIFAAIIILDPNNQLPMWRWVSGSVILITVWPILTYKEKQ